jgi:GST-like protein
MLDLYTAPTPNGKKIPILLAELGEAWRLHRVDLKTNQQKSPGFLAINPNGKIPALVDEAAGKRVVIFESGAILQYLAERAGKFLPTDPWGRYEVLSWLYWQVGGPGPMFGQAGAFGREQPRNEKAYEKFIGESKRLATVLDGHLAGRDWVAGDYSIADIALYPWFAGIAQYEPKVVEGCLHVAAWTARVGARPGVQRGMELQGATEEAPSPA